MCCLWNSVNLHKEMTTEADPGEGCLTHSGNVYLPLIGNLKERAGHLALLTHLNLNYTILFTTMATTKFASYKEEAQHIIAKLKSDNSFCYEFFYQDFHGQYSIAPSRDYVIDAVWKNYEYKLSPDDFSTIMYEKLWDDGTWHPLDTYGTKYGCKYSFFTWLYKVSYNTITSYLKEIGVVAAKKGKTPGNTRLLLKNMSPEGCQLFIDEVMPAGNHHDLLTDIYVCHLSDEQIMEKHNMDAVRLRKSREKAERRFKKLLLNANYFYEDDAIAENYNLVTVSTDFVEQLSDQYFDNTATSPFGDVFGVNLTDTEVEQYTETFIRNFFKKAKLTDNDFYVMMQRWYGTPSAKIAGHLGRRSDWVDNKVHRIKKKLEKALRQWWYNHT